MSSTIVSPATGRGTAVLLVGSMGCAMTVLDTNVVGIVLPTIARDLNASFADIEWVISAYVLCFAALLLPAGSIADHTGTASFESHWPVAAAFAELELI